MTSQAVMKQREPRGQLLCPAQKPMEPTRSQRGGPSNPLLTAHRCSKGPHTPSVPDWIHGPVSFPEPILGFLLECGAQARELGHSFAPPPLSRTWSPSIRPDPRPFSARSCQVGPRWVGGVTLMLCRPPYHFLHEIRSFSRCVLASDLHLAAPSAVTLLCWLERLLVRQVWGGWGVGGSGFS